MSALKEIHRSISFKKLSYFLLGLAFSAQLIVIIYNHFSGYYVLTGYPHFFARLLRGVMLSFIAGYLIVYPDLLLIKYLNVKIPWGSGTRLRILVQILFTMIIAIAVSSAITFLADWVSPYTEDFWNVIFYNSLMYCVVNVLVMSVMEAWLYYNESKQAKEIAEDLQKELSQIKFEVLKSQINPHFLFNSLNVLSSLINKDTPKAQQFIDEFSHIYRYVLETIEQPVSCLRKELDFMQSYLFLQQIRYGDTLRYDVSISSSNLKKYLPPLSLQVVLENAIKHNVINESKPLKISIYTEGDFLIVQNNIQLKISGTSTGLGLKNLTKRYALISDQKPIFHIQDNYYIAKLPLIDVENESTNY